MTTTLSEPTKQPVYGHLHVIEKDVVIGAGTFIGHGVVVRSNTRIGEGVVIGHNTVIEEDVTIGNGVRIQACCYITKGTTIDDNVFIGPCVCTTNDWDILSHGRGDWKPSPAYIGYGARIGARALLLPGVEIGAQAFIGAGSIVTKHVGAREIWHGEGTAARFMREVPENELIPPEYGR